MATQLLDAPESAIPFANPDPTSPLPTIEPEAWADHFESRTPEDLLAWAMERWGDRLALVTSFQATGLVLLDMAWRIDPQVRVLTLDTGRLPQETFNTMEAVRRRYGIEVEVVSPDAQAVERLVNAKGPNLFYESLENRLQCCRVRKVEPLRRALAEVDAWITGVRRDQSAGRRNIRKVAFDGAGSQTPLVKLAPLAGWTEGDVSEYVKKHNVPRHPLYDRGYRSIGCAPCTRPVAEGADPRSGRWWWENAEGTEAKECGLHLPILPT